MSSFSKVSFKKSSSNENECPKDGFHEFAMIGRSNVGKSSLINSILNKKNIAKTSKTPGKTQLINHYLVENNFYIVDLPGYGYSKLSKKQSEKILNISSDYILNRENLLQIFVLIDIRHKPFEIDIDFIEFLISEGKKFNIIFTKADKLKKNNLNKHCEDYFKQLNIPDINSTYFICSSTRNIGISEIRKHIQKSLV
ncbi:MAG: ribosome biogenesis GTP-binding protein YihA/YsxC [Flavobacteriaceae bacterium]